MNRIALSLTSLAIAAATSSAFADDYDNSRYSQTNTRNDVATVLSAQRIGGQSNNYEHQECWNEQSNNYDDNYYRDGSGRLYRGDGRKSTGGAVIGAIVGGALGNQAGKGDGRKASTIAGAVIGGVIGSNANRNTKDYEYRDNTGGTVRRCRTVYDNNNNSNYGNYDSYNVTYRYAGQTYRTVTDYRPGRTMRVVVNVTPQNDNGYSNR
jgi:uncharacterized protein YcfJ